MRTETIGHTQQVSKFCDGETKAYL